MVADGTEAFKEAVVATLDGESNNCNQAGLHRLRQPFLSAGESTFKIDWL